VQKENRYTPGDFDGKIRISDDKKSVKQKLSESINHLLGIGITYNIFGWNNKLEPVPKGRFFWGINN